MAGFLGPRISSGIQRRSSAFLRGPGAVLPKGGCDAYANTQKKDSSPFDLVLSRAGSDFTVMGMHFKLGLYETPVGGAAGAHQPDRAGPLHPRRSVGRLHQVDGGGRVRAGVRIIGDPAKRHPKTRQSADHSMLYLVCTMLPEPPSNSGRRRNRRISAGRT